MLGLILLHIHRQCAYVVHVVCLLCYWRLCVKKCERVGESIHARGLPGVGHGKTSRWFSFSFSHSHSLTHNIYVILFYGVCIYIELRVDRERYRLYLPALKCIGTETGTTTLDTLRPPICFTSTLASFNHQTNTYKVYHYFKYFIKTILSLLLLLLLLLTVIIFVLFKFSVEFKYNS